MRGQFRQRMSAPNREADSGSVRNGHRYRSGVIHLCARDQDLLRQAHPHQDLNSDEEACKRLHRWYNEQPHTATPLGLALANSPIALLDGLLTYIDKDGSEWLNFTAFYETLLDAKVPVA